MHGYIVLGDAKAETTEGYALPIPPNTRHGYTNIGSLTHHLPFIFGSLKCGGWGVFLDVEPAPRKVEELQTAPVLSHKLNGTVYLEREIAQVQERFTNVRYPIVPAEKTDRDGLGGLELSISRVSGRGVEMRPDRFCAVSVVRGSGVLEMAGENIAIKPHDHFGIPTGISATLTATGSEPMVLLDSVLKPVDRRFL